MSSQTHLHINDQVSIPRSELDFQFSRSGGPGGQHGDRAATRVALLFDVEESPSLSEAQRRRVKSRLRRYVNKQGVLRLVSQGTRSQARNREMVIERFQKLMAQALRRRKRRRPTKVPRRERERRLADKHHRSRKKKLRQDVDRWEW